MISSGIASVYKGKVIQSGRETCLCDLGNQTHTLSTELQIVNSQKDTSWGQPVKTSRLKYISKSYLSNNYKPWTEPLKQIVDSTNQKKSQIQ